ncbi:cytoplasmic dynein 2 intermediate chain 1-like [Panonychus citri]|uniref:cytoplasmic dynein 2 intermediate chain 1-like n=1 Tax=Panonychus citri TaxID=50023 RepID=UPI0023083090|nr:cytoplasmic dynein 2 intermediate chain 1-like [Panonychus citri]XP_053210712.1 cytoplasmic dynein 2 intermediate chain 1-like [Panonychus citri]XP_053212489.1 cytoplasmic dynein 2 intermediate chain 1-like [Panonychus citri]XP_053214072.1 cytoplasmic dynein 2 intermediate chain 1-like [Panonychus citri]
MSEKTSRTSKVVKNNSNVQVTKTSVPTNRKTIVGANGKIDSRVSSRITISNVTKDKISTNEKIPVKSSSKLTVSTKTPTSSIKVRPTVKTTIPAKSNVSNSKITSKSSITGSGVTGKLNERRLSRIETKTATKSRSSLEKSVIKLNDDSSKKKSTQDLKIVKPDDYHQRPSDELQSGKDESENKSIRPGTANRTHGSSSNSLIKSNQLVNQQQEIETEKFVERKQNITSSTLDKVETDNSLSGHESTNDIEEVTEADYSDDFEDYESDFEEYESDNEMKTPNDKDSSLGSLDSPVISLSSLTKPKSIAKTENLKSSEQSTDSKEPSIIRWEITLPPPTIKVDGNKIIDDSLQNQKESESMKSKQIENSNLDDSLRTNNLLKHLLGPDNVNTIAIQTVETSESSCQSDEINSTHKNIQCPARSNLADGPSNPTPIDNIDILRLSHFLEIGEKITKNLISSKTFSYSSTNGHPIIDNSGSMYPPKIPSYGLEPNNLIISYHLPDDYKHFQINSVVTDSRYVYVVTNYGSVDGNKFFGSLILVWNLLEPRKCEYLLHCKFNCTKVITDNEFLIIAGSVDGSLVAWDLREPSHQHSQVNKLLLISTDLTLRNPSFTTAIGKHTDYHQAPILQLFYRFEVNDDTEAKRIVSLDESGKIIVWLIVESYVDDLSALQQVTIGLRPGSCIRLQISMVVNLPTSYIGNSESSITCIDCSPTDSWNYLIGTNLGSIYRYSKYLENSADPMEVIKYTYFSDEMYHPVTCISHHPNPESESFLVGYMDGSICLFSIKYQFPIRIWLTEDTGYSTIINSFWLSHETELFLILDQTKGISVRDVKGKGESLFEHQNGNERIIFVNVSTINLDEYFLIYALADSSISGFNLSNHMSNN